MKSAKDGGLLPHEIAFAIFFGITATRLFVSHLPAPWWGIIFTGFLAFIFAVKWWSQRTPEIWRQRVRLFSYLPLMLISYKALGFAVPLFHPDSTSLLAEVDHRFFGKDAALFLDPWINPVLTDFLFALYLSFFAYLAVGLWDYGTRDLKIFRRFTSGLFTVYGVGFLGYTFLPAGGPYLEISDHFPIPLAGGWITNTSKALIAWGGNRVDCFPCLHFAVSFFILIFDYWHCRNRFFWMAVPCIGIWFSTIYLRQHYVVDLFAGVVLVVFALMLVKPTARTPAPSG